MHAHEGIVDHHFNCRCHAANGLLYGRAVCQKTIKVNFLGLVDRAVFIAVHYFKNGAGDVAQFQFRCLQIRKQVGRSGQQVELGDGRQEGQQPNTPTRLYGLDQWAGIGRKLVRTNLEGEYTILIRCYRTAHHLAIQEGDDNGIRDGPICNDTRQLYRPVYGYRHRRRIGCIVAVFGRVGEGVVADKFRSGGIAE